ncbi:MAG: hypothetical protein WEC59_05005 [Salibacteraceae bacterium]
MKRLLYLGLILTLITACGDPKLEKVNNLKKEAFALHDEVMPRMGEISELSRSLKEHRKSVEADTSSTNEKQIEQIKTHVKALDDAYEAMMEWMNHYKPEYEKEHQIDSAVVYYEEQKESISEVKSAMEKSIEDAENLLDELD